VSGALISLGQSSVPFVSVFSHTFAAEETINGYTLVQVFIAPPFSKSGSKITLSLESGQTTPSLVTSIYAGQQGVTTDYSFDGTQVPILYGGLASFTVPANTIITTDPVSYAFDQNKNFVVAWYFTLSSSMALTTSGVSGVVRYYLAGNDVSTTSKTGYSGNEVGHLNFISGIQVA